MSMEFKIGFTAKTSLDQLKQVMAQVQKLPQEAYNHFKSITPIDTGNARSRTSLKSNKTIEADYPYAKRLDEGWSRQAPRGMIKPTEEFINKRIKQITGR
ncbi:hypothetical protein UFOVP645_27 [uncultured Caudovirales phage]|uniref:HK97 gp10 family phage protein n=1 Tax=uncultured Caudovirales phage TaxID=2100421 RepID=A0A6J5N755_9CAUD|nr:hypothetical protein UFOVP645_27 [uncultured Caudovirales phage]